MKKEYALILPNEKTGRHDVCAFSMFGDATEAVMTATAIYGKTAYAVDSTSWSVTTPSFYKDGVFYNVKLREVKDDKGQPKIIEVGSEPAERILSQAEQIEALTRDNEELKQAVQTLMMDSIIADEQEV